MQLKFSPVSLILLACSVTFANATDSPTSSCPVSTVTEATTYYSATTSTVTETITYYPENTSSCPSSNVTVTVTSKPTSTPSPACPSQADAIFLRRMWNAQLTVHFYSTYGPEVAQFGTQGYVEETPQGMVYPTQFDGTVPLFRCVDAPNTPEIDYFYTADPAEWQAKIASGCQVMPDPAAGGISQGIGYLYTSPVCGAIPLYRLFSSSRIDYVYTIDATERQSLISSGLYVDQGITGYVLPN